jgi:hypothetical protein
MFCIVILVPVCKCNRRSNAYNITNVYNYNVYYHLDFVILTIIKRGIFISSGLYNILFAYLVYYYIMDVNHIAIIIFTDSIFISSL